MALMVQPGSSMTPPKMESRYERNGTLQMPSRESRESRNGLEVFRLRSPVIVVMRNLLEPLLTRYKLADTNPSSCDHWVRSLEILRRGDCNEDRTAQ